MPKKKLSPEEMKLFRQSVGKVTPVKSDQKVLLKNKKPSPYPQKKEADFFDALDTSKVTATEKLSLGDTIIYLAAGLQKNVIRKLRRGHFGIDAELDLHGLNSRQAKIQLLHFLHICVEDGCRCVHIIHGKGYRSADNVPVLKNELNKWLRQHKDVLAFCSAAPKDGGSGAVMVLLQLSRKYSSEEDSLL